MYCQFQNLLVFNMNRRRTSKNSNQDASRDVDRLLVALSSARISSSHTLTEDQEDDDEDYVDLSEDVVEEISIADAVSLDPSQILRRRQNEVTATATVGGPAATQNSLETSIIDLCDETTLTTDDETVFIENFLDEVQREVDSIDHSSGSFVAVPEEAIIIEDDEDGIENESHEVMDMFEAQVRACNTRAVPGPGANTTIELSESEEELEENEEAGALDTTLNILTIRCPICLAGFREIQADGKSLNFV